MKKEAMSLLKSKWYTWEFICSEESLGVAPKMLVRNFRDAALLCHRLCWRYILGNGASFLQVTGVGACNP